MQNIISELITIRKEKNITQVKLAELSGIKQPVISRIEKGRASPKLNTVSRLLHVLNKDLMICEKRF